MRPQAYTDSRGFFSFQYGNTPEILPDASVERGSSPLNSINGASQQRQETMSFNCELRAALPGFRSDTIPLSGRRNLDDPNVGTIILHRIANVEGLTTSATSALAPKEARKAYEKAIEALKKSKIDEGQASLLKATELYPRYAAAWYDLGRVYEQRDHSAEAREAYNKAIAADSKFVNPYERLYLLAVRDQKWEEVATLSDREMRLNPYDFPGASYYNAVANYQLEKFDAAEKSAREALKVEEARRNPKSNYLLGVILAKKGDFKGSAECLRAYLANAEVPERDRVVKMLADIEKNVQAKAVGTPEP